MKKQLAALAATAALALSAPALAQAPNDAQIAHIAYTAGQIDVAAGRQALQRSHNARVRAFAQTMVRDHEAVNRQAVALVTRLHVTPAANPTSAALSSQAAATLHRLGTLRGAAFDRAYVDNEVAYHRTVNGALRDTLIPSAQNAELKSLLQSGLALFTDHQTHAEHLASQLR
jgi:putative membrane protein